VIVVEFARQHLVGQLDDGATHREFTVQGFTRGDAWRGVATGQDGAAPDVDRPVVALQPDLVSVHVHRAHLERRSVGARRRDGVGGRDR